MKQLITSFFGTEANDENQNSSPKVDTNADATAAPSKYKYAGWQLNLKYLNDIYDDDQLQVFSIKSSGTDDITASDASRDNLKSMIASFYEQINSTENDDVFVNFNNSLVIRKSQFVSLSLTTVE